MQLQNVPHREGGDATTDRVQYKSATAKKNGANNDTAPCKSSTQPQGMDKRSDERIAQSIQKLVKESMLSDSPSFERA